MYEADAPWADALDSRCLRSSRAEQRRHTTRLPWPTGRTARGSQLAERVGQHYLGDEGRRYFGRQLAVAPVRAELNRRKFEAHIGPEDVVVDFGCGGGFTLAALPGKVKIGVEANDHGRAMAERLGIRAVAASDELAPGTADVVLSNHALEHTLQPMTELRHLYRVLKPGGRLLLHVPINDWRVQRDPDAPDPNHHLYTWTPLLLANLLREAGFEVLQCRVAHYRHPGRLTPLLGRILPAPLFDLVAAASAYLKKRHEIRAIARRP